MKTRLRRQSVRSQDGGAPHLGWLTFGADAVLTETPQLLGEGYEVTSIADFSWPHYFPEPQEHLQRNSDSVDQCSSSQFGAASRFSRAH
jgi:hypothetical protein